MSDSPRSVAFVIARIIVVGVVLGVGLGLVPGAGLDEAHADGNDLVMSRLGTVQADSAVGNSQDFRALTSELGVVIAPRLLSPSDTLGFGGFQFAADLGFTTISNDKDFWRVRESTVSPTGGPEHGGSVMPTLGLFVRKGIWLPLPSFEVGAGMVQLLDSNILAAQGYAKFALHEGYHDLPVPSLAVRGAVSRMMGTSQLDLTVVSLDVSLSKAIGLLGSINLEPYLGGNLLFIVPRSKVVDPTPNIREDGNLDFVFRDQDNISRNRIFAGFKLQYHVFALLFEANIALSGSSVDDQPGDMDCAVVGGMRDDCDSTDQSGSQQTYTVGLGLDF